MVLGNSYLTPCFIFICIMLLLHGHTVYFHVDLISHTIQAQMVSERPPKLSMQIDNVPLVPSRHRNLR